MTACSRLLARTMANFRFAPCHLGASGSHKAAARASSRRTVSGCINTAATVGHRSALPTEQLLEAWIRTKPNRCDENVQSTGDQWLDEGDDNSRDIDGHRDPPFNVPPECPRRQ